MEPTEPVESAEPEKFGCWHKGWTGLLDDEQKKAWAELQAQHLRARSAAGKTPSEAAQKRLKRAWMEGRSFLENLDMRVAEGAASYKRRKCVAGLA